MKITIPTGWNEVTIRQFVELSRVKQMDMDPLEQLIEIIAILSNTPRETIAKVPLNSLKALYGKFDWMQSPIEGTLKDTLTIDGVTYRAACFSDFSKITAGQYIDHKNYTKDPKEIIYNLHSILSAYFIPEGKKYGEYDLNHVGDIFWNSVTMDVAYPIAVFFCNLSNVWKTTIVDYLQNEVQKKMKQAIKEM